MSTCTLCDLPLESDPVTPTEGSEAFCCQGCHAVWESLGDVDPEEATEQVETDDSALPEDACTDFFTIDGMHCSTCELYLESEAAEQDGVYQADASYASSAMKVAYDPDAVDATDLSDSLSGMGYRATLRDEATDDSPGHASRLLVGGIFGMMAMTWYALFLYPTYFGYDPVVSFGTFDGAYLYSQLAVVTAVILLYTGRPILRGAYVSLRTGRPNVDLLITIAAVAAYSYSTVRLLTGGTDLYYDVTIVVILAVTIGNYYEDRIKNQTASLLADLTKLQVNEATRRSGESISVEDIEPGDELRVAPGERIPVDGTIIEGSAAVDEALVTGESIPETKRPGDDVRGGTVVTDAPIIIEAGPDAESTLDRVVELFWNIHASKPGAQRVADKLATIFVPVVLVTAVLVAGLLLATGASGQTAMLTGLTVLIVSCPCALGLATPLAVAAGLQSAATRGIVITTPAFFESATDVDTVVFDKTGTLTDGEMAVTDAEAVDGEVDDLLGLAAAVETHSAHPIAKAIVSAMDDASKETSTSASDETGDRNEADIATTVDSFEQHSRGVSASYDGNLIHVGHPQFIEDAGYQIPTTVDRTVATYRDRGDVPALVGYNGAVQGVIAVGDSPRSEWESVVETVGADRKVVVLTGDEGPAADRLRDKPFIDEVYAGVPPDGKAAAVRRLVATETVAMVGDGSNDAPAIASADVGIALESGTKLATDAADAILLDGDIRRLPAVFEAAGATRRRIRQNLAWAFVYNGIAIPLAIAGVLNPLFAALAMATSSLLVVGNSARQPATPDAVVDRTEGREDARRMHTPPPDSTPTG
jgi:Cu2+-exporting ATPase